MARSTASGLAMPIQLSPEMLAHCYDMVIAASPTLTSWNLPPSEDIKFRVMKRKDRFAHHEVIGGVHHIVISKALVVRFETLAATLIHELIHLHQDQTGLPRADNKTFEKFADVLCKELDLDRGAF